MTSAACRGVTPGQEPIPVAAANTFTGQRYWTRITGEAVGIVNTMTVNRRCVVVTTALLVTGCSQQVDGSPVTGREGVGMVNIDRVLLSPEQMQQVTGAGQDLTIIPSMDGKSPVDVTEFAKKVPPECRFLFAETQTFGSAFADFHKTTFQDPPRSAVISQGAAVYPTPAVAGRAFDELGVTISACGNTTVGPLLVGAWEVGPTKMTTHPGECGRDYRLKSAVLVEVTYCALPEDIPETVMTEILERIPG